MSDNLDKNAGKALAAYKEIQAMGKEPVRVGSYIITQDADGKKTLHAIPKEVLEALSIDPDQPEQGNRAGLTDGSGLFLNHRV